MLGVTYLDLLHELCLQRGYALLLTAHHTPAGFATAASTDLVNLDVVRPSRPHLHGAGRRQRLRDGDLVIRCSLGKVDGDLQAAAELMVQLLGQHEAEAA